MSEHREVRLAGYVAIECLPARGDRFEIVWKHGRQCLECVLDPRIVDQAGVVVVMPGDRGRVQQGVEIGRVGEVRVPVIKAGLGVVSELIESVEILARRGFVAGPGTPGA